MASKLARKSSRLVGSPGGGTYISELGEGVAEQRREILGGAERGGPVAQDKRAQPAHLRGERVSADRS